MTQSSRTSHLVQLQISVPPVNQTKTLGKKNRVEGDALSLPGLLHMGPKGAGLPLHSCSEQPSQGELAHPRAVSCSLIPWRNQNTYGCRGVNCLCSEMPLFATQESWDWTWVWTRETWLWSALQKLSFIEIVIIFFSSTFFLVTL